MGLRTDEFGVFFDVFHETTVIFTHPKKIARLLNTLQRLSRGRIAEIAQFSFVVSDECFFFDVVPSRVFVEVDVVGGGAAKPEGLGGAFVTGGSGPDVVVVGDEDSLVEALEAGDVLWRFE